MKEISTHAWVMLIAAILYWVACIGVGLYTYKKGASKSAQDFFVAGRGLGKFVLGFAIMATTLSAWLMLGHQGLMYASGMPYLVYYIHVPFMGVVGLLIFTRQWLIGKKFGFLSPGEMYSHYYESHGMRWVIALVTLLYCIPYSSLQLTGAGYVFSTLTEGAIPFEWGAIIMASVVLIYVLLGGVASTALVDAAQGVLLVLGLFGICWAVVANVGPGEIVTTMQSFDAKLLTMPGGNGLWFWTYTLSLALSTSAIYLSPAFTIWSYSAKSPKIFRWQAMVVWVVLIGAVYYILSPIIGMGGRILFPALAKTDTLTPLIMTKLMPIWMYVIVGIGLLAAMNSTAAGYMITSGVIVSQDIYKDKFRPQASDQETVWVSRIIILAVVLFAFWISQFWKEHLVLMGNLATAFATQLAPALIGVLYWRRATAKGAMFGILAGLIVAYLTYGVWRYPLHIHCAMWGLLANLAVFFFFAFTSDPPSKANRDKYDEVIQKGMAAFQKEEAALGAAAALEKKEATVGTASCPARQSS